MTLRDTQQIEEELFDAVESLYWMVRQYCEVHGENALSSKFLGAAADAMRICDRYCLLDIEDLGSRNVWADIPPDGRDIRKLIKEARI
jgi:hypothetical protein